MASALLAGDWERGGMLQRIAVCLGGKRAWHQKVVESLVRDHDHPPSAWQLQEIIGCHPAFLQAVDGGGAPRVRVWFRHHEVMTPSHAWELPRLENESDVARLLGVTVDELQWLADCHGRERSRPPGGQRHYVYTWADKRRGGQRLVEAPKPLLKAVQRRLLHHILDRIPAHPAARGFRAGHSIVDYVRPHVGRRLVLHLDIRDFFASVHASRVHCVFRMAGYSLGIARLLTGLCTNTAPPDICHGRTDTGRYAQPHLPQGAPTSPALANLCCFRLDLRLASAARAAAADYTRYADDLAFSGDADFARSGERFARLVWQIVHGEGFAINHRKTRQMRPGVRQSLAGLVLNAHPNIGRRHFDQLKAILTNCIRYGPASQNRDAHPDFRASLAGRVAFFRQINSGRAERLARLLCQIEWDEPA